MKLTAAEKMALLMKRKGITVADMASELGCTVQNIYLKLKRDKWSNGELEAYGRALGCTVDIVFTDWETGEEL